MSETRHEIRSQLMIKISEQCQLYVIFNFEHITVIKL